MEKDVNQFHLPKIISKNFTADYPNLKKMKSTQRVPLQSYLQEARLQQIHVKRQLQDKKEEGYKKMQKSNRMYLQVSKLQIKKVDQKEAVIGSQDQEIIDEEKISVWVYKHDTIWKPPHRYSTAVDIIETALAFYQDQLLLYGGFGSQKYLSLAKFSLKNQEWEIPKIQEKNDIAIYSHTMAAFKGYAYIYGGIKMDTPTNELIQINLKSSVENQLSPAPYRRRDHSMTVLSRFLIVQGGIEGQNEVKNNLFYFDTESSRWLIPQQYQMPFLSHHSIIAIPLKFRKKQCTFQQIIGENLYIFGGKTEKDVSSNKLYRLRVRESGDLTTQEIFGKGAPQPRYSACSQFIQPNYICVYGGKCGDEIQGQNVLKGIFKDLILFNIDKKQWISPSINIQLPFRFGASCCASKNRLFIFGGNQMSSYSDGNIVQLQIIREGSEQEVQEGITHKKIRLRG